MSYISVQGQLPRKYYIEFWLPFRKGLSHLFSVCSHLKLAFAETLLIKYSLAGLFFSFVKVKLLANLAVELTRDHCQFRSTK
jgi:hypothetical protein